MKIAFLSRYQNQNRRGVETFVAELASRLSKTHEVVILTGKEADSWHKIISGGYDLVVPLNGRWQSLKTSLGRVFAGYKVIISGHSGIGRDDIWNIVVAKPDFFVALTSKMESWAKGWAWGSKVEKIPNGVDTKKFNPKGKKIDIGLLGPVVLCVGALVWYKHQSQLIKAVSKLDKVSLLLVGEGPDKELLSKLGKNLLGEDRFKIMTFPYEMMPDIYRSADLFSLPSWDREAFGIAYLEALASNLPVVAPDDLSRREIIGEAGIFCDTSDSDKYAVSLKNALDKSWGNLPRDQSNNFSWDIVALKYQRLFERVVKV